MLSRRSFVEPLHGFAVPSPSKIWCLAGILGIVLAAPTAEAPTSLRIGIAAAAGDGSVGLPSIAESLSAETLVGLELDGRPIPRLAERWELSPDGRELRLHLPRNLSLHDGRRVDASTVARLLTEALQKSNALQMHARLKNFYNITTEAETTLLLKSGFSRVLALEELANITLKTGVPDGGLGPFVVESLGTDGMTLHRFNRYFRGESPIGRVEFHVYRSQRAAWTGLMRDETDALYEVNREAVEFLERESRIRTHSFLRPYVSGLIFNVARPVFRTPEIRRAIVAAVNRDEIVKSAYRGRARVAEGPLAPTYWALGERAARRTHDRELARSLLSRLQLRRGLNEMPARLRFSCLVPLSETQPLERVALLMQKQLYDFGIDMQFEVVTLRDLLPRLASGDFDSVLMEFFGVTPSWVSYFWHSPAPGGPRLISSGYAVADRPLEAMTAAQNEDVLRTTIAAVYQKFADDPPALFIAWPEVTRAVSTRFEVPVEKGRDIMGGNLWLWRPAKER